MNNKELIGLTVEEANERLKEFNKYARVTMKDGQSLIVTMDYRTDRLNVHIKKGLITAISGIG